MLNTTAFGRCPLFLSFPPYFYGTSAHRFSLLFFSPSLPQCKVLAKVLSYLSLIRYESLLKYICKSSAREYWGSGSCETTTIHTRGGPCKNVWAVRPGSSVGSVCRIAVYISVTILRLSLPREVISVEHEAFTFSMVPEATSVSRGELKVCCVVYATACIRNVVVWYLQ